MNCCSKREATFRGILTATILLFGNPSKAMWSEQLLTAPRCHYRGLSKPDTVRHILRVHYDARCDHTDRLSRLLNLELSNRLFVDADPYYLLQNESVSAPVPS